MKTNLLYTWAVRIYTLNPAILYTIVFILFFARGFFILDPDFGWHLASGQYIVAHGIPQHDIYSYTMPNFPWIHHEWLVDSINSLIYTYLGGYTALALLYAGLWTAAVWLLAGRSPHRLLIVVATLAIIPFAGVRAVAWSVFLSAVLIRLYACKNQRYHWLIVPLLGFWANVHGSFVVGLAYIAWQWLAKRSWRSAFVLLCAVLATVITPYGVGMYTEVIRTVGDTQLRQYVTEWSPVQFSAVLCLFVGTWGAMVALSPQHSWWRRFVRFDTLLLVMAVASMRHVPLFVVFALPFVLRQLSTFRTTLPTPIPVVAKRLFIALVAVAIAACAYVVAVQVASVDSFDRESRYPRAIAATLRQQPCKGNVFAQYGYSGYLIWQVPGQKVFIDGRMPSWRMGEQQIIVEYAQMVTNTSYRNQQFQRYNIHCIVWPRGALATQLQKEGWQVALREPATGNVLLVR